MSVVSGRRFWWEWDKCGGGALVFAVGVAFAEQGGGLGGRDTGDFEQEIRDDGGCVNRGPAPWRAEREDEEADPDDGFEKVIWMSGVFPKADSADGFRIGTGCFEGGHLSIGNRFTDESDGCDQRAKDGQKPEMWIGIGGDEIKGDGQEKNRNGLCEEKQEKHRIHFSRPDLAEFSVAGVFVGMMFRDAAGEVVTEPDRPCADEDACKDLLGFRCVGEKKEDRSESDAECPKGIDG